MPKPGRSPKYGILLLAVFAAYLITAELGLKIGAVSGFVTLVWAPTGIALAALLLYGPALWPAIAAAAFLVNSFTGANVPTALGIAAGNTLEAICGAFLLRRFAAFQPSLGRLRGALALICLAAALSTLISATIGVASLRLAGRVAPEATAYTWLAWWLGDMMGDLVVAPVLLVFGAPYFGSARRARGGSRRANPRRMLEAATLALTLVAATLLIFTGNRPGPYLVFPALIWAAVRFHQRGGVLATFVVSALTIWATSSGLGPFARQDLSASLIHLQTFMAVVAITTLILSAIAREQLDTHARLRAAIRARDEFLSIASHELKTPLTSLKLQLQLTQRGLNKSPSRAPAPEQLSKVVTACTRQVDRLTTLVDDLLDVSRIQAGKLSYNLEEVRLAEIVAEVVEKFTGQLNKIETSVDADVIGHWDRFRIEQTLVNLLSNAIKYAPASPIRIVGRMAAGVAVLSVQDWGPGIEPKSHAKVFERFERATASQTIAGLGLGLFIVRQIVEGHGGSVRIESELGKGATFVVELPAGKKGT